MKTPFYAQITFKFVLTSTLITAFFTVMWGGWSLYSEKKHLLDRLETQGRQLVSYFKAPVINLLQYEEMGIESGSLDNLVEEMVANREFPSTYAYITDQRGIIIAHNDPEKLGLQNSDPLAADALKQDKTVSRIIKGADGSVATLDFAMPLRVGSKSWGSIQVGFSAESMNRELAEFRLQIIIFSIAFFLLGSIVFYVVGVKISRPLLRLSHAMTEISHQNLGAVLPEHQSRDEIGVLHVSFIEMMQRLQNSESERQKAVQSLIQSEKLAIAGKLVAGVSHEVNNPLAALSSCIYNLENVPELEREQNISIMKQSVQRIQNIVAQLMDFSRVGDLFFTTIPSDVFFEETVLFSRMAIKKTGCHLQAEDACVPPTRIIIDKGKINQVILNLVMNAADASPPQGCITLKAYLDEDWYCIAITDHGQGIHETDKEKVFELFYTTKTPGIGTGMGLAISNSIVERHKGTIALASVPGETTFTIKIPRTQE